MDEAPGDELKLKVTFDKRERNGALRAASMLGPLWRRPIVMLPVIAVGAALIGWAQSVLPRTLHSGDPSPWGMLVVLVGSVALVVYVVNLVERLGEENERHAAHPDVYTLNDEGLEISGVDDLTLMSWPNMTRVHETDRFFLFVVGPEMQYLPKRALDAAQEAQVRALIARHGPAAHRSLPPSRAKVQGSARRT